MEIQFTDGIQLRGYTIQPDTFLDSLRDNVVVMENVVNNI